MIVDGSAWRYLIMASLAGLVWLQPAIQLVPMIIRDRERSSTLVLGNNAVSIAYLLLYQTNGLKNKG